MNNVDGRIERAVKERDRPRVNGESIEFGPDMNDELDASGMRGRDDGKMSLRCECTGLIGEGGRAGSVWLAVGRRS